MPMKDDFDPDHSLPIFLADRATRPDSGNARDRGVPSSRVFKSSILIAIATAAGIAALFAADPAALVANVAASLVGNPKLQPGTDQSAPTIQATTDAPVLAQSAADTQTAPPTTADAPIHNDIAASEPAAKDLANKDLANKDLANKDQAEKIDPSSEDLFRQFQAWATAQQDARPRTEPAQPAQYAPSQVTKNAPTEAAENDGAKQTRRHVRAARNARAEINTQNARKMNYWTRGAGAERPPAQAERRPTQQDPRAPDPSAQPAQAPSFLPIFGQRN